MRERKRRESRTKKVGKMRLMQKRALRTKSERDGSHVGKERRHEDKRVGLRLEREAFNQ